MLVRFSKKQRDSEESNSGENMFRVIIAGSRSFANYEMLKANMNRLLQNINDEISIVCGTAQGADRLGEKYAKEMGFHVAYFPADWKRYGKAAGYIRNKEKPDKPLNVRDTLDKFYPELKDKVLPVIQELGL